MSNEMIDLCICWYACGWMALSFSHLIINARAWGKLTAKGFLVVMMGGPFFVLAVVVIALLDAIV